jgi:cobalt-zinc-cadmium efflux system membrane fusion protein
VTLSLVIALYSCGEKTDQSDQLLTENTKVNTGLIQVTQVQFDQGGMTLGRIEEKNFNSTVTVNGMIDVPPENRAVVTATMGGYIKTTPLLIGDVVRKGQLLVTLENPDFIALQQQYMEVSEQLTYLKSEYHRLISMKTENITSQKSYLKAESSYKTAVATHTGLDKQLRMLNLSPASARAGNFNSIVSINAPISGSITKVNITKGSYVSPATEILEIIDTDHIHLELSVFEKDIMKIKKGQKINFNIPEADSETYHADVYLAGTSVQQDRTIKVHGHIENDEGNNFLTGMFLNAQIITASAQSKALPSGAFVEVDGLFYILVLDKKEGGTYFFHKKEIKTLESYDGYSMLDPNEPFTSSTQFLTKGAFELIDN